MDAETFIAGSDLFELDNGEDLMRWSFTAVIDPPIAEHLPYLLDELAAELRIRDGVVDAAHDGDRIHIATEGIDFTGVDEAIRGYLETRLRQIGTLPW